MNHCPNIVSSMQVGSSSIRRCSTGLAFIVGISTRVTLSSFKLLIRGELMGIGWWSGRSGCRWLLRNSILRLRISRSLKWSIWDWMSSRIMEIRTHIWIRFSWDFLRRLKRSHRPEKRLCLSLWNWRQRRGSSRGHWTKSSLWEGIKRIWKLQWLSKMIWFSRCRKSSRCWWGTMKRFTRFRSCRPLRFKNCKEKSGKIGQRKWVRTMEDVMYLIMPPMPLILSNLLTPQMKIEGRDLFSKNSCKKRQLTLKSTKAYLTPKVTSKVSIKVRKPYWLTLERKI